MRQLRYARTHNKRSHKQMIVISGDPGTGKTIVGLHLLYAYVKIFNRDINVDSVISHSSSGIKKSNNGDFQTS
ncbi:DNA/RNA helicase domain-containing protein [Secundilactobacillus silagei]|uniref:nSTAND3 domain-containing NTPase n=1 Tax=Secundilactobacillus silagei TaxID=1293415 RepID=UPI0034E23C64